MLRRGKVVWSEDGLVAFGKYEPYPWIKLSKDIYVLLPRLISSLFT